MEEKSQKTHLKNWQKKFRGGGKKWGRGGMGGGKCDGRRKRGAGRAKNRPRKGSAARNGRYSKGAVIVNWAGVAVAYCRHTRRGAPLNWGVWGGGAPPRVATNFRAPARRMATVFFATATGYEFSRAPRARENS